MKEIVDYDALNKKAGVRATLLGQLVEKMADLPEIRRAAEVISATYDRLSNIFEQFDAEAKAVIDPEVWKALGLISQTQTSLVMRSQALTKNAETIDMFPETLILMKAVGTSMGQGKPAEVPAIPEDWVPRLNEEPKIMWVPLQGKWGCAGLGEAWVYGDSPNEAYLAWKRAQWVPEPDTVPPPPIPPMPSFPK